MNWEFRKLIRRSTPKGRLSPLADVLKNLQARLPTFETHQLIPNALLPQATQSSKTQELFLKMKTRRHDTLPPCSLSWKGR